MSNTYSLRTRNRKRHSQSQINPVMKMSTNTACKRASAQETQSASDQPSKENVKHVPSANVQTYGTLSASDQPSKENVKHVRPANAQPRKSQSVTDQPSKGNVNTYILQKRKRTRDSGIRSTQQGKFQARTCCESTNTELCQPRINPVMKMPSTHHLRTRKHTRHS